MEIVHDFVIRELKVPFSGFQEKKESSSKSIFQRVLDTLGYDNYRDYNEGEAFLIRIYTEELSMLRETLRIRGCHTKEDDKKHKVIIDSIKHLNNKRRPLVWKLFNSYVENMED